KRRIEPRAGRYRLRLLTPGRLQRRFLQRTPLDSLLCATLLEIRRRVAIDVAWRFGKNLVSAVRIGIVDPGFLLALPLQETRHIVGIVVVITFLSLEP